MLTLLLRRTALVLLLSSLASSAVAQDDACHHKPGERIRSRVVPERLLFGPGEAMRARLEIELLGAAGALRVVARGTGSLAAGEVEVRLAGPWRTGASHRHELTADPVGTGAGRLEVDVEALDDFGEVIQRRRVIVFADVDEDGTWASGSSDLDLELRRVGRIRAQGRLSAAEAAEWRRELARAACTTSRGLRQASAPSGAVERLRAAYESMGLEPVDHAQRGASDATVEGLILWTDRDGNLQPLAQAELQVVVDGLVIAGTTVTDANGAYAIGVTAPEEVSIRLRVLSRSPVADVRPDAIGSSTYFVESEEVVVAPDAMERLDVTIGNDTTLGNAFSVHAALVMIGGYTGTLSGGLPSQVEVLFPTTSSTSSFGNDGKLRILLLDRHDWDVVHHEYGHYVQEVFGFVASAGGRHGFDQNLAAQPGRDKEEGIGLAWSEGWPTYFGLVGQGRMGGHLTGIPGVGDTSYSDTEDTNVLMDVEAMVGLGEDNEVSVMACLFDLVDQHVDGLDQFSRHDTLLFDLFISHSPKNLGEAWDALASVFGTRTRTEAGAVFAHNEVAPRLLSPADRAQPQGIPTFKWRKNGGGTPNPLNDFKIVFWDREFDDKLLELELGNTDQFTPTLEQWQEVNQEQAVVNWVIEGKNLTSPVTAGGDIERYWSQAHRLGAVSIAFVIDDTESMTEEIDGVRMALDQFLVELSSSLGPDDLRPTVQILTFKDSVTEQIVSNNHDDLSAVVHSLSATFGFDCPEVGVEALERAVREMGTDGTILFATDASSQRGNISYVIEEARAKNIDVQVILSGDCEPISLRSSARGGAHREWQAGTATLAGQSPTEPVSHSKPEDGEEEPDRGPLDDDGQATFDDHGDTPATATLLGAGEPPTIGFTDSSEIDWFALDLEAGQSYFLRFESFDFHSVRIRAYGPDATTEVGYATSLSDDQLVWTPTESGRHYLTAVSAGTRYSLSLERDPVPHLTSAVQLYSLIAQETGGSFSLQDGVNGEQFEEYVATMLNVMLGGIRPTAVLAQPNDLPRTSSLTLTLTGSRTRWDETTAVEVLANGVTVGSVEVLSPTLLLAKLTIADDATLGFADVHVTTTTGGLEEAMGRSVVEVTPPVPYTMLLSVSPASARRGETLDLTLSGSKTFWDPASTLELGPGITVNSLDFGNAREMTANVTVAEDAAVGFRSPFVFTSGNEDELERGFLVVNEPLEAAPTLGLTPSTAPRGARLIVSVRAEGTSFLDGTTTADFGPGVEVQGVEVFSPVEASVQIRVAVGAPLGFRDVALSTGAEELVIEDGFFVDDFTDVFLLDRGLAKLSDTVPGNGTLAFAFDATAGETLDRLFVIPFGDGTNGTVAPPDLEVTILSPTSAVLHVQRTTSAAIDLVNLALPETGSYRVLVTDRGGAGGTYKGIASIPSRTTSTRFPENRTIAAIRGASSQ